MIAAIENAMLGRLRAASEANALGYRYATLETYPAEWDAYLKDKAATIRAPAAWVVFGGWRPIEGEDPARQRVTLSFGLVVMDENVRGETATRHGAGNQLKEPGSYRLAVDAARLLAGQDLGILESGLKLGGLHHVARLPAWQERRVSMLAIEFSTEATFEALDFGPAAELADFTAFHANWDVEPHGGVDADPDAPGVQLPADAQADATDHVTLETE